MQKRDQRLKRFGLSDDTTEEQETTCLSSPSSSILKNDNFNSTTSQNLLISPQNSSILTQNLSNSPQNSSNSTQNSSNPTQNSSNPTQNSSNPTQNSSNSTQNSSNSTVYTHNSTVYTHNSTVYTDKIMPPLASLNWQEKLELAKTPLKIVGLNQQLEKPFLRLTGIPHPENVRPFEVLKKSFVYIQEEYKKNCLWSYIEEQFRSIRQDLAVQTIKNDFTVKVYELNARLALKNKDLGQFNQCQTQLTELYKLLSQPHIINIKQHYSNEKDDDVHLNKVEFVCYRVIYMALQNMRTHLLRVIAEIHPNDRQRDDIIYAMSIRRAIAEGNWRRYFRLARGGPYNIKELCDIFEDKMRIIALLAMSKSSLTLDPKKVMRELFFTSQKTCLDFLNSQKTIFNSNGMIDSKQSALSYAGSSLLNSRKIKAMG